MSPVVPVALQNPFPGLRPFQRGEEHLFFGRESQVDKMVDKLAASGFLSVVGTSGTGKSSLVNCGLLPALHRGAMGKAGTSWCVVRLRPGGSPIRSMARAFAEERTFSANIESSSMPLVDMLDVTLRLSSLGLGDLFEFARLDTGTNLMIYVDQFEELFRYRKTSEGPELSVGETVAFVNLLLEAHAQEKYPIFIVLTMRSDFMGECSQFDRLPEVMNEGHYLVPRLTRIERRAAIAGPIGVAGAELSPVLLTRLVNDVGDNPDQLSIMQHAINRTWAVWQNEGHCEGALSLEHYESERVGTMLRALDNHAEEAYIELATPRAQKICERVFKALTDKGTDPRGIRRPMPLARLCKVVDAGPDEVKPVLDVFRDPSRSFLMPPRAETLDATTVIDISHEILMRAWLKLRDWADEEALSAVAYRRIAETAELHRLGKAGLWGDPDLPDLKTALEWKAKQEPNAAWADLYSLGFKASLDFLDASKNARDLKAGNAEFERRWRKVTPFLVGIALAVFLFTSSTISQTLAPTLRASLQTVKNYVGYKPASSVLTDQIVPEAINGTEMFAGYQISAVICALGYVGVSRIGKRMYRRYAFAGILAGISTPQLPANLAKASLPERTTQFLGEAATEVHQNTTAPASFLRILAAGVIDFVIAYLLNIIIVGSFLAIHLNTSWILPISWLLSGTLYRCLLIRSRLGATLGYLALGIRLTDLAGRSPSVSRVAARHFASYLSWFLLGLGFLLQLLPPKQQSLQDRIAGTILIRRRISLPG